MYLFMYLFIYLFIYYSSMEYLQKIGMTGGKKP